MHRSRSAHTAWVQPFCLLSFELEHKYPRGGSKFLFSYWLLNVTNCGLCISILFCFKPEMCFFGKHFVKIYNKHFLFFLYWVDYYGCPQLSHQIQITHIKYKILTSNTNYSHQKQIAHIKYRLLTSNTKSWHQTQITHIKYKLLTSNTNHSHQIQNPDIKK